MELLEQYVSAVRTFLPKAQQDDIAQELSANLQAQMDDHEAELGRPLSEAEQEVILQQLGHPLLVAGRYQRQQGRLVFGRQLIGTTLFPLYLKVLWINLGLSCAVVLLGLIALAVSGTPITFAAAMNALLLPIAIQFGIVTGLFTVVDHSMPRLPWKTQRRLTRPAVGQQGQQIPRLESLAQIVAILVFLFWLWFFFDKSLLLFGPAATLYQPGPIWHQVAPPIVLLFQAPLAQGVVNLFRPDWTSFRLGVRVVTDLAALAILVVLLRDNHWVVLAHPIGKSGNALETINTYVSYGLWSLVIGSSIVLMIDSWKLTRGEQKQAA